MNDLAACGGCSWFLVLRSLLAAARLAACGGMVNFE